MILQELTPKLINQYGWRSLRLKNYVNKGYKKYGNHLVLINDDDTKTIVLEYERNILGLK